MVFDAFGTLFDPGALSAAGEAAFPGHSARLMLRWRELQLQFTWQRTLMGAYRDFAEVTAEALAAACREAGLPADSGRIDALVAGYAELAPFPDAVPAVRALRQGAHPLAVLSNGTTGQLTRLLERAGLGGDLAILSADAARSYKPASAVYGLVAEHLGVAPARTVFVSSNAWDVAGALHFGFRCVWVNRANRGYTGIGPLPEHRISTLEGLPALVPQILGPRC